jgi:MFS family permease
MSNHRPQQTSSGPLFAVLVTSVMAYALVLALVSPVLPAIQRDLGTTHERVAWVMTGCLVSAAILTPILGRMGDRIGKLRVIVARAARQAR